MYSFEQLEESWARVPSPPRDSGRVECIVVRPSSGERQTPQEITLSPEQGVHGDRWSAGDPPNPDAQVSLMNIRVGQLIAGDDTRLALFGDNLLVDFDLSEDVLPIGAKLRIGSTLLEVTPKKHTGCEKYRLRFGVDALRWVNHKQNKANRFRGLFCRVLEAGTIRVGDSIEVI